MSAARIVGAGEAAYTRHPGPGVTTSTLLVDAGRQAVADAGLRWSDIDGFGVASFTLRPDHAVDLAWRAGLGPLRWMQDDPNGGASGIELLAHAADAIAAGRARNILLVAGDRLDPADFTALVDEYNSATRDHLTPLPMSGPNGLFAMLTARQMAATGLTRADYGRLVVSQREWAESNPGAVYRKPMSLDEYLAAPIVAEPLGRFDCVPPVSGADAVVVSVDGDRPGVRVRAVELAIGTDDQDAGGLVTPLAAAAPVAWERSGLGPEDVDLVSLYDDYPAIVAAQLVDAGFTTDDGLAALIADRIATHELPLNTTGGQLSAGQAGPAGSMHGLVEATRQLLGRAPGRSIEGARVAAVSGYGMVLYRYGAIGGLAVLEADA